MLKIAYCGYDYYACCLAVLISHDDVRILKIYTCGEGGNRKYCREVIRMAEEHGIPYQDKPIAEKDVTWLFDQMSCDFILSAGYSWKIPIGDHRGLNIHPTLLPAGRGAWPFPRIILNGCKESGVTIHKLTNRFDAGDIVLQRSFPLDPNETQDTLHCKNQMVGPELLREWLEKPEELWEQAVPQQKGEYWNLVSDTERTITPDMNSEQVNRVIRAFSSQAVLIETNDGVWYARNAVCQNTDHTCSPGTILYAGNGYLAVAVREGILYASQAGRAGQTSGQTGKRSIIRRILRRSRALLRQFL